MSLDGFSMHALVKELSRALIGGRIDKITQPNKQTIILSVRQPGRNYLLHITTNPANPAAHLLEKPLENPPEPPVFCMVLRKQIETGRIAALRQHGLDRLLLLDIDTLAAGGRITTKTLVLELMGKYSNIILVEDGIILDALRKIGTTAAACAPFSPDKTTSCRPCRTSSTSSHLRSRTSSRASSSAKRKARIVKGNRSVNIAPLHYI